MKRRNAEGIKPRRSVKPRSKIDRLTEGFYGSTFLYLKFLLVWALVLMADFIVEFRFEYLWPFWLLLRSVYDSFKYQGLAFSVFFVCIAITSDVICYLFIPVQWLFFAASTYVWVQYVWHTERGICLPTVSLWLIFVYIEASVRLRDFSIKSHPFHLDLCRPFAAHCIGYPVVTLGFGFKSYISYKLRLRRQVVVRKENDFYVQLLQQALPPEQQNAEKAKAASSLPSKSQEETISNGVAGNSASSSIPVTGAAVTQSSANPTPSNPAVSPPATAPSKGKSGKGDGSPTPPCTASDSTKDVKKHNNVSGGGAGAGGGSSLHIEDLPFLELHKNNSLNSCEEENLANEQHARTYQNKSNGVAKGTPKLNSSKDNTVNKGKNKPINTPTTFTNNKDEVISRLESDIKRLKSDLQSSRNLEQDLRSQVNNLVIGDKLMKSELYQLRQDNESLQTKLHHLVTSRQQDKHSLTILERRLQEERKQRTTTEQQLAAERKKRQEDQSARAQANRGECSDSCKARRRELENEVKQTRRETKLREDQIRQLERETETLRQYKDAQSETEVLMSALHAMQDKNTHLETSLSAETRVKMDLFSALGDANRRIEILQNLLAQREGEVDDLKSKIAEVVAVTGGNLPPVSYSDSMPRFSSNFATSDRDDMGTNEDQERVRTSTLNPHASDYTPKLSP